MATPVSRWKKWEDGAEQRIVGLLVEIAFRWAFVFVVGAVAWVSRRE